MLINDLLFTTVVVVSAISLVGCGFIMVIYHKCKSLQVFAFKLVYVLTILDGIRSLFSMIPTHLNLSDHDAMCQIQGFALEFASLAGVLWTGAIALILYFQVILQRDRVDKFYKPLLWIIVIFSFICSVIPLFSGDYQYVGGWCWISTNNTRAVIYRYGFFYAWVWLIIIFDLYAYIRVISKIKTEFTIKDSFLHEGRVLVNRLRWYPIVLVVCYAPLTATRILQTLTGSSPIWLLVFSTAVSNLLGFFNAILYGFNESVKIELKSWIQGIQLRDRSLIDFSQESSEVSKSFE